MLSPLSVTPAQLEQMLKSPVAMLFAPLTHLKQADLYSLLETLESAYGAGLVSMLRDPELVTVFKRQDEEMFPSPHFVGEGELVEWLEGLIGILRKVRFPGEIEKADELQLRVRIIRSRRCCFCGVLPWGTVLIGAGLIQHLQDVRHLVAILLHEIEHFETWDFSLVLNFLPLLFAALNEDDQNSALTKLVDVLRQYISHRSQYLEKTADAGAIQGLAYFGLPGNSLAGALRELERASGSCPDSLVEVLIEAGLLTRDSEQTSVLSSIETHPPLEYRITTAEQAQYELPDLSQVQQESLPKQFNTERLIQLSSQI